MRVPLDSSGRLSALDLQRRHPTAQKCDEKADCTWMVYVWWFKSRVCKVARCWSNHCTCVGKAKAGGGAQSALEVDRSSLANCDDCVRVIARGREQFTPCSNPLPAAFISSFVCGALHSLVFVSSP
ncbi:hypothetical protein ACLOJK_011975 [Asimina triloba]